MSRRTINNRQDILDSRDIIARIAELEDERNNYGLAHGDEMTVGDRIAQWAEDCDDDAAELNVLLALAEEAGSSAGWPHGEALIRDSYFETYAQELAEDCGMMPDLNTWPNRCIDWEQAARELQMDYTSVDFDGVTYWIRS